MKVIQSSHDTDDLLERIAKLEVKKEGQSLFDPDDTNNLLERLNKLEQAN